MHKLSRLIFVNKKWWSLPNNFFQIINRIIWQITEMFSFVYSWTLVIFTEQGFGVGKFFMAMVFPFSWFEKLILYRIPTFCLFPFGSKSSHLYLDFCFLILKTISELCCQDDRAPRGILRCPRYDRVSPMERVVGHFKILTQTETWNQWHIKVKTKVKVKVGHLKIWRTLKSVF